MASGESLTADIDRIIALFNARKMDLPDHVFDRKTQFVLNGAAFEALLGRDPNDPLVLMLARGPAGFRFAAKALQHAIPDAKLERGDVDNVAASLTLKLWLSGTLRGTAETINTVVAIALTLAQAGHVEIAEARVDPTVLERIREARLRP